MIRPDQIPDAVVEAAARMICRIEYGDELGWDVWIGPAENAIAAALNEWPMASPYDHYVGPDGKPSPSIILPLPEARSADAKPQQEGSDDA